MSDPSRELAHRFELLRLTKLLLESCFLLFGSNAPIHFLLELPHPTPSGPRARKVGGEQEETDPQSG